MAKRKNMRRHVWSSKVVQVSFLIVFLLFKVRNFTKLNFIFIAGQCSPVEKFAETTPPEDSDEDSDEDSELFVSIPLLI
jgi:hypothetical protein